MTTTDLMKTYYNTHRGLRYWENKTPYTANTNKTDEANNTAMFELVIDEVEDLNRFYNSLIELANIYKNDSAEYKVH